MGKISNQVRETNYKIQQLSLDAIRKKIQPRQIASSFLFDEVKKYENGLVDVSLKKFSDRVIHNHPDLSSVFEDKDWKELERRIQTFSFVGNDFANLFKRLRSVKPRLMVDVAERAKLRNGKKHVKHVGLKQVYMLGENGFYFSPDSFMSFVRGCEAVVDVSKLEKNKKLFSDKNMTELAHAVGKRIEQINEHKNSLFMGFHRMRPVDAALVAAKSLDLKWKDPNFITIPFSFFEARYWSDVKKEEKEDTKKLLVMKERRLLVVEGHSFTYQPRLYPFNSFPDVPQIVKDTVGVAESLPDMNGCPMFDYYWLLVPSININHALFRQKDEWKVWVRKGSDLSLQIFKDEYEAAMALDATLVKDGYFFPVVLGERDGKCYFITVC